MRRQEVQLGRERAVTGELRSISMEFPDGRPTPSGTVLVSMLVEVED